MGPAANPIRIPGRGVELHGDKAVTELRPKALEALPWDHRILAEPQAQHTDSVFDPLAHHLQVPGGEAYRSAASPSQGQRQAGLAKYRGQQAVVEHHPEGESAGEAHAHRTDSRTAAPTMFESGQGS